MKVLGKSGLGVKIYVFLVVVALLLIYNIHSNKSSFDEYLCVFARSNFGGLRETLFND